MCHANPTWGAPRIHGELLRLGIAIAEATVGHYMVRRRPPPSQTWRTFLTNHIGQLVSVDFFVVPTLTFRVLFVFVVLAHDRRQILHVNVTGYLSVSNSSSGRRWKLDHAPAVGDPTHMVEFGTGRRAFAREASRRVAFPRRMAPCRVVGGLEVGELPLQITGIPAQHMIQAFSPHRPDQPFHQGV